MRRFKIVSWRKYGLEFLSIFIAVISAFALNNWNDDRRANISESKILTEIANGLEKDLDDIRLNITGHKNGISACSYFKNLLINRKVDTDSLMLHYFNLTRDFISLQNVAGYETLKSQGLELIRNDSLRLQIISLYEYDYNTLRKLEEEYSEMQFQKSYFVEINRELAPHFQMDEDGNITGINLPLKMSEAQKKTLFIYLWKIQINRRWILSVYADIEDKINRVRENIHDEK